MINFYEDVDFNSTVFTIEGNEIVQHIYKDLCNEHADETTTPTGVAPRYHTRENNGYIYGCEWYSSRDDAQYVKDNDIDNGDDCGPITPSTRYELWSWGSSGNHPKMIERFESEQAAEHALLLTFRYDLHSRDNNPIVYSTREEAERDLKELVR